MCDLLHSNHPTTQIDNNFRSLITDSSDILLFLSGVAVARRSLPALFLSFSFSITLSLSLSYEWKNEAEWIQYIVGMYNLPWDMVCSARAACSLSYSCDIWWWLWSVRLIILSVNEFCTNTHPPPPCPILFRYYSCLYLVNTKISMRKLLSFCLLLCLRLDWNAKQLIRFWKLENRPDKQFIRHKLSATKVRTHLTLISECCCCCFVSLVRCQFRLFLHFNLFVRTKIKQQHNCTDFFPDIHFV